MKPRSVHDILRERLLLRAGLNPLTDETPDQLRKSNWNPQFVNLWIKRRGGAGAEFQQFVRLMKPRMVMGAMRYGHLDDVSKPHFNNIESALRRLRKYRETGDKEMLVDVANLCLVEFSEGNHKKAHFGSIGENNEKVIRVSK